MAYNYLADGALIEQQVGLTSADAAFWDEFQKQAAAALEKDWIHLPLTDAWSCGGTDWLWPVHSDTDVWALTRHDRGDTNLVEMWRYNGSNVKQLYYELGNCAMFKPGCLIDAVQVKTGGSIAADEGQIIIQKTEVFTSGSNYPGYLGDEYTIALTTDQPFNGHKLIEKTSINKTILSGYRYVLRIDSGTGDSRIYGVRIRLRYPVTT